MIIRLKAEGKLRTQEQGRPISVVRDDTYLKLADYGISRLKAEGKIGRGGTGANQYGNVVANDNSIQLADYGISRDLSSRSQALAEAEFPP